MKILVIYDSVIGNTEKIARAIADQLKKAGGVVIVPPEGFYVIDTEGPLKEGELERAAWARQLL